MEHNSDNRQRGIQRSRWSDRNWIQNTAIHENVFSHGWEHTWNGNGCKHSFHDIAFIDDHFLAGFQADSGHRKTDGQILEGFAFDEFCQHVFDPGGSYQRGRVRRSTAKIRAFEKV